MHHLANRLVFLAITVVIVLLVAFLTFQYQSNRFSNHSDDTVFIPQLTENIENIATIEITQKESSLVIDKKAGVWVLMQQGGYQVDVAKVRQLVESLASLEKLEPKTNNPERFSALGLEAPSKENTSARVALFDAQGQPLADVIIGSLRRTTGNAMREGALYVRNSNEDQSWLVKGGVNVSAQINDWMNRELLRLNSKHVASIKIDHPRNTSNDVMIERIPAAGENELSFKVSNLAQGKKVSSQLDVDAIVDVVTSLNFIDVVPEKEKTLKEKDAVKTTYSMDGNLDVTLSIWVEKEDKAKGAGTVYWIAISHKVTSDNAPEAIKAVTERLAQYHGWLYQIGGYQGKLLTKTLSKLTQK